MMWRARFIVIPRLAQRAEGSRNCSEHYLETSRRNFAIARSLAVCAARNDMISRVG